MPQNTRRKRGWRQELEARLYPQPIWEACEKRKEEVWAFKKGETLAEYLARTTAARKRRPPVRREELPPGVRRIQHGRDVFQARVWIKADDVSRKAGSRGGAGRNVNLGLFHAEDYGRDRDAAVTAAAYAAREFLKRMIREPQPDSWEVVRELQGMRRFGLPVVPLDLLPRWVRRIGGESRGEGDGGGDRQEGGERFEARVKVRAANGEWVELVEAGPWEEPGRAHEAMRERIREWERRGRPARVDVGEMVAA